MDYVSCPLILYSQDKIRMMDFLSDVFEFDVDPEEDLVHSGPFPLKLVELSKSEKGHFQSIGIKFTFKLKTVDQIDEIVNKYNFFQYRKEQSAFSEKIDHIETTGEHPSLSIKDIDGRIWQFDVEEKF